MAPNSNEIDDFLEIEDAGASETDIILSVVHQVHIGKFGPKGIRTYLSTVKVEDLKRDIKFYEKLTENQSWPVSQIIQREIDPKRIQEITLDYLLGEGRKIKYFPPIVIALLPIGTDGKLKLEIDCEGSGTSKEVRELIFDSSRFRNNDKIKKYIVDGEDKSPADDIYLIEVSKVFGLNLLAWDKAKYHAIVIDGQHRLQSLFKGAKEYNEKINKFQQDVVFLDLSYIIQEFKLDKNNHISPVEAVRRVFIDINTNAKVVSPVRQILMDDKDLTKLFVQSLVDEVSKDGSDKTQGTFLPPILVDWYGESLKHEFPHLTGILSLHQIITDFVVPKNLSSIDDLRKGRKVNEWVSDLNSYFLVDEKIATKNKYKSITPLKDSLSDYKAKIPKQTSTSSKDTKESELFSFDYRVLEIAQETFEELYVQSIVSFFKNFLPYSEAIGILNKNDGFNKDSTLWHASITSKSKIIKESPYDNILSKIKMEMNVKLSSRYYLIFTVLGQKSIFRLFFMNFFKTFVSGVNSNQRLNVTKLFTENLNRFILALNGIEFHLFGKKQNINIKFEETNDLNELGAVASSFWEGICFEDNRIIYNAQGIKAFSSILDYSLRYFQGEVPDFSIPYMESRIKRILKNTFDGFSEHKIKKHTNRIILAKEKFLQERLDKAIAWDKQNHSSSN